MLTWTLQLVTVSPVPPARALQFPDRAGRKPNRAYVAARFIKCSDSNGAGFQPGQTCRREATSYSANNNRYPARQETDNLYNPLLAMLEAALLPGRGALAVSAAFATAVSMPFTALAACSFVALFHRRYLNRTQKAVPR